MVGTAVIGAQTLPPLELPLPHARTPPARAKKSIAIVNKVAQRRRRARVKKSITQASAAPPGAYHGNSLGFELVALHPVEAAWVEMVRVAVTGLVPLMLTGPAEPKLKVGREAAPCGLLVIVAASVTLPVKPNHGVSVRVEVFPLVAPGERVTGVPVIVR